LARHYVERHGKTPVHIPNGFEPPVRQPPRAIKQLGLHENGYILFVGRLSPEKGCHTLIRAFAQVQTDKYLVLAGRVTYDDHYQHQLVTQANSVSNILFTGFVRGAVLQELYSNAYLVVHPSELEGLSISLLEALSYNNCLLVSNVPENLEVVRHVGHSFQTGDSTDLARQIQRLVDRPDLIEATRAHVRKHTSSLKNWDAVAAATYRLLLEVAGSR
jgi:glycosyltransferase involved in cell wall biosynthesis